MPTHSVCSQKKPITHKKKMFKISRIDYAELPTEVPTHYSNRRPCQWFELPLEYIDMIRKKLALEGPNAYQFEQYIGPGNKIYLVDNDHDDFEECDWGYNDEDYQRSEDKVKYLLNLMRFMEIESRLSYARETLTQWRSRLALESYIGIPVTLSDLPLSNNYSNTKPIYKYENSKLVLSLCPEVGARFGSGLRTPLAKFATLHLTTVDDAPITKWCLHCGTIA